MLVYNDATFSSRDFQNLVKIGQASKLDRLVTTGRFGLGFSGWCGRFVGRRRLCFNG